MSLCVRTPGTPEELERQRFRAIALLEGAGGFGPPSLPIGDAAPPQSTQKTDGWQRQAEPAELADSVGPRPGAIGKLRLPLPPRDTRLSVVTGVTWHRVLDRPSGSRWAVWLEGGRMGTSSYTKKGMSPDPETSFRLMDESRPPSYHIAPVGKRFNTVT